MSAAAVVVKPAKASSKKRKQPDEPLLPASPEAKKPHLEELPLEVLAFFQKRFDGSPPLEQLKALTTPKCESIMAFMNTTLHISFEAISGTHYSLSDLCSMFLDAFIVSGFGVLICFKPSDSSHHITFKFVDNLAQFIDITTHLRAGTVRTLLYCTPNRTEVSLNTQQRFQHTYSHVREQVLNRMMLRTTNSTSELAIYKLMKQCQHWAWWSNIYPTELVFIVAKLLYGYTDATDTEEEEVVKATVKPILQAIFSASPILTTEQYTKQSYQEEVHYVNAVLTIAMEKDTQCPVASQLIINPLQSIHYTNTDQMDNRIHVLMSTDHTVFNDAPVHIIQQYIKTAALTVASCPQLGHTETAKAMFRSTVVVLDTLTIPIQIPVGLLVLLSFYNSSNITRMWHNIMLVHIHNALHPNKSITKWAEVLQKRGSEWYKDVMTHQNILQTFMNMSMTAIGAVFDRSYKLALNIASGVVDPNDWIISFFTALAKRSQTEWTWQPIALVGDNPKRFQTYIQSVLLSPLVAPLLEEMWTISNERLLLATTGSESINFNTYNWTVAYQSEREELQLLWSCDPWWKKPAVVTFTNGLHLSGTVLHRMELEKYTHTQQTIIRSDHFGRKYWYNYSTLPPLTTTAELNLLCCDTSRSPYVLRPQKIYMTLEHESRLLAWFKPALRAFFGAERHLNAQLFAASAKGQTLDDLLNQPANDRMLVGFFQMCLQRFYNYNKDDVYLDMSLYYAHSPEFLSPLMIQHLIHLVNTHLLDPSSKIKITDVTCVQSDRSLTVSDTIKTVQLFAMHAPYIPSNSIALDTWLYTNRSNTTATDYDYTAPDKLLIVMKTGEWHILRLHSMYGITFATDLIYQSSISTSTTKDQDKTYSGLSKLLAGAQFVVRSTHV